MQLHQFKSSSLLNLQFANQITFILKKALEERDRAYLVVSGGKTPQGLFQQLAQQALDWEQVTILLTDERCVDPHHEASNERLIKSSLLQFKAGKAEFISLYANDKSPEKKNQIINQRLEHLPQFDVVILGMGTDGHTASLFPCSPNIAEALSTSCSAIAVHPQGAPLSRMSLTASRLRNSRYVFLHILGQDKYEVFQEAMIGDEALDMPIRAFIHHPHTQLQVMFAPE